MQRENLGSVDGYEDPLRPDTLFHWKSADRPVTILDIRKEPDFEEWHIDGSGVETINIPAYEFIEENTETMLGRVPTGDPLVVVCAEGKSSALIAGWLSSKGYDAVNLAEGMEGWAKVYISREVTAYDGAGTLLQYQRPSSGCLGYLLCSDGEAAVFDPLRAFTDRYLADANEFNAELRYAFDTHIHADHVSGVRDLVDHEVEGVVPEPAIARGVRYDSAVTAIADGETIEVGAATVEALHTPGHTTGMTAYHIDGSVLLTGDGLFTESVARPDLEEGDEGAPAAARQLYQTLHDRILPLPDETVIAGGHTSESARPNEDGSYTARVRELAESMSLLGLDQSAFIDRVLSDMPPRPSNYQRIIAINLGREAADEEEAFELELGPNNCATSHEALS